MQVFDNDANRASLFQSFTHKEAAPRSNEDKFRDLAEHLMGKLEESNASVAELSNMVRNHNQDREEDQRLLREQAEIIQQQNFIILQQRRQINEPKGVSCIVQVVGGIASAVFFFLRDVCVAMKEKGAIIAQRTFQTLRVMTEAILRILSALQQQLMGQCVVLANRVRIWKENIVLAYNQIGRVA